MVTRLRSNSATEANPLLADGLSPKFHEAILEQPPKERIELNFFQEAIDLLKLALPIMATLMLEFLPGAFSVALVGHIDSPMRKEYVDAAMLAVMFLNITGVSIGSGLSTAMDTLCSQTVGAGKLYNLGMYFQSGLVVLGCMYIPCLLLNFNSEFFLVALGQDPTVAQLAGSFSRVSVFSLPGIFLYELLKKVLQAQKIVSPMAYYILVGQPSRTWARLSWSCLCPHDQSIVVTSVWLFFVFDVESSWQAAWEHVPQFFSLGAPGMLMIVMEWWAYEVCALIAGWMSNPVLSISVQSVLMGLASQAYSIFLGLNIATTVRLGNALGANEQKTSCPIDFQSCHCMMHCLSFSRAILPPLSTYSHACYALADANLRRTTQHALAIFAVYELIDCMNCTAQSILKGMGKQSIGVWVNAGCYYVIGIPAGILLAFHFSLGVQGLWIGLGGGLLFGFGVYLRYICTVNWKQMAVEAIGRTSK
ncbi:hypothetical protein LEN26_014358 [Aphanomyces euteiches]|nr:hypothetical protein LEN26_014358 [Aphanomyces euteiches]